LSHSSSGGLHLNNNNNNNTKLLRWIIFLYIHYILKDKRYKGKPRKAKKKTKYAYTYKTVHNRNI